MSRINTNVQSLIAQRVLGNNNFNLNRTLERLSSGLRINLGKYDPAGLIASENLSSDITATNDAIANAERADQVVNIAEGGLQEASNLLVELQGLLTSTASQAGLSNEEKEANQLQIDSLIQTIDRIAGNTSFQGIKLLNGNFDFQASGVSTSVSDFSINGAKFTGDSLDVDVIVTQSAQKGQLYLDFGGANLDTGGAGAADGANSAFTIEISGALGSRELSFSSGTSNADIAAAINTFSDVTGVTASADTNGVSLLSSEFGSSQFVSVKVVNEGNAQGGGIYKFEDGDASTLQGSATSTFAAASNGVRDSGQNLGANINGTAATSNGRTIRVNSDVLDVSLTLTEGASQSLGSITAFNINGGGASFQLGAKVDIAGKVSLGIGDVAARKLGKSEDADSAGSFFYLSDLGSGKGLNVVDGDLETAQKVVSQAIADVSGLRGRLGAFQKNTIQATVRSLGIAVENSAAAQSVIRDADFASETAELTRSQILTSASTNILAQANAQPQSVLQLLG
ncbi:MAG: flagellin [Phycisphaerales bacterium JB037]